ncbi:MAG: pathogenesis-related family 1 protein [Desulfobulbales bacterium]
MKFVLGIMVMVLIQAEASTVLSGERGVVTGMTDAHNRVRAELGLPPVAWSDELAQYAQEWTEYLIAENGCRVKHHRQPGKPSHPYGENIYWASAVEMSTGEREVQQITPQHVVNEWVSEVQYYDYKSNNCRIGRSCGHYTQVVWKNTRHIGCGVAVCADKSQVWVCNYDPPGNYVGEKPY